MLRYHVHATPKKAIEYEATETGTLNQGNPLPPLEPRADRRAENPTKSPRGVRLFKD